MEDSEIKTLICSGCKTKVSYIGTKGPNDWFIDDNNSSVIPMRIKHDLHFCDQCRISVAKETLFKGPLKCERCFKLGEEEKFPKKGHVKCVELNMTLCYECSQILHSNIYD